MEDELTNKTPDGYSQPAATPPVAFHPNMIARGAGFVPGALICKTFPDVQLAFDLYSHHVADTFQNRVTNGQAAAIRGPDADMPNLAEYGCTLLKPGTLMEVRSENGFPLVKAKSDNGTIIVGVTLPAMVVEGQGNQGAVQQMSKGQQAASQPATPEPAMPSPPVSTPNP